MSSNEEVQKQLDEAMRREEATAAAKAAEKAKEALRREQEK